MSQQQQWVADIQMWDIQRERVTHDEALYRLGEYACFVLMWTIRDFEAGLVARCSVCYLDLGIIADTYKQPSQDKCPNCFGTTFEGGYKALLVRPSLWQWTEQVLNQDKRGDVETSQGTVNTTADFRCQPRDYVFRSDGQRFKIQSVDGERLVTGFGIQSHSATAIGYTYGIVRINPSDPGYLIPPNQTVIMNRLDLHFARYPKSFSDIEVIRGPITN